MGVLEQGNDKEIFAEKRRERGPQKNLQEKEARGLGTCNKFRQLKYTTLKFLCSFFYKHCFDSVNTLWIAMYLC